ncbi:MAG: endonuclease Q family protein [bacterium]
MPFIADFHIHSKYSRATSREMDIPNIARFAKLKGISLIGTGDFTHFQWLVELKKYLKPKSRGIFECEGVNFILTSEVSSIYTKNGKLRKIHNIILAPDFITVEKINSGLSPYGKLDSDGRPILKLDAKDLLKLLLNISPECVLIPAHIWTPHFSLFGSESGFDTIEECFGDLAKHIFAMETGLSSDPSMNWRLSALDRITLISDSDAHSPKNMGREANMLDCAIDYSEIVTAMKTKDKTKFLSTIEFFPEEGKYHFDGHRECKVRFSPKETMAHNKLCPVCGKKLTIGVMHRVEVLSDREENITPPSAIPFKNIIPLEEIIAESLGLSRNSITVEKEYFSVLSRLGTEFDILMNIPEDELKKKTHPRVVEGITKTRRGEVKINPGYDGVYGEIEIDWNNTNKNAETQIALF